jgi:prepilin-type N-terminal cleavage/methylation domain-containing protein
VRVDRQSGMTLIELMMAMALSSLAVAGAFALIQQTQTVFKATSERSRNNDEVTLAIGRLDRLIRSGNILYDPSGESDPDQGITPGLALRIYTQANSVQKCVQWRISEGVLQERSWSPQWQSNGQITTWWNVAEGLTNTQATPAFSLDDDAAFGGRLLKVQLNVNTSSQDAAEVEQKVAIEGRNTLHGYDASVCNVIPS